MGGRMSGESPRELKAETWNCGSKTEWPFQIIGRDPNETFAAIMHASRQQIVVCEPLGQQALSERISEVVWHSDGCEAAKSTGELCRQIANNNARTMSGRLMHQA
jgi:hypothetical protein